MSLEVSIVMATCNRLDLLRKTVQSIQSQTVSDWELLIADDGSGSSTIDYLKTLLTDARVRLLRLEHSANPGVARNAGIAETRAPLVAFMDSDDIWRPNKLEKQLQTLRDRPECGWCYTAFQMVDGKGRLLASESSRPWTPHEGDVFQHAVCASASIRVPSVVVRTPLLRKLGGFDENLDCAEDYDLWMRLALESPVAVIDEALTLVRRHPDHLRREPGSAHRARDYSLRKMATIAPATQRELLARERSRNAIAMATELTNHRKFRQSFRAIAESWPFSWRYPWWWYQAARALARASVLSTRMAMK